MIWVLFTFSGLALFACLFGMGYTYGKSAGCGPYWIFPILLNLSAMVFNADALLVPRNTLIDRGVEVGLIKYSEKGDLTTSANVAFLITGSTDEVLERK